MSIPKNDLEEMNNLLTKGSNISDLVKKYPAYDYVEIYTSVNNNSILGKKRMVTNRINSLVNKSSKNERKKLSLEAKEILDELYKLLKINSSKLIDIEKISRK